MKNICSILIILFVTAALYPLDKAFEKKYNLKAQVDEEHGIIWYKHKKGSGGNTKIYPVDQDTDRILLSMGKYGDANDPIPVVILNGTIGKTAWVADFSRDGLENVNDDHKELLNSLLFSVSSKKAKVTTYGGATIGHVNSYLNIMSDDMFEIYRINLGTGQPF